MAKIKVVAHRGASGHAPELTFAAFSKAIEMGADSIEVDVHQSADGKIVIIHDQTLDRTTNGTGLIASKTYKELQRLDAGSWFDDSFAGERIPLFSEFIESVKGKVEIIVEVKHGSQIYPGIEKNLRSILQSYDMTHDAVVSSSRVTILNTFKTIAPGLRLGKVLTSKEFWRSLFQSNSFVHKQKLLEHIKEIYPHLSFINSNFMDWAVPLGFDVIPWTINKERKIRAMIDRGVHGVITDFPDIARRVVK